METKVPNNQEIVIVSGLPRSGTSLMMKMLEVGGFSPLTDEIRQPDEDNPKGYYEFERVKKLREGDTAWISSARGKVVKVISALLPSLPMSEQYRVVFMQRELAEVLASQRQMLIRRGEDPSKVSDQEMTRLFEKHLQQVDEWLRKQTNVRYIYVNYNQLLTEPSPVIQQIEAFFAGQVNTQKMVEVIDQSLYRQRKD
jgi:hypothetical protein